MQGFQLNSFAAAIVLSTLLMGVVGAFVLIPVACIQWTWNSVAANVFPIPVINAWQAILLYLAAGIILYLAGFIQIEVKSENLD
jgi:hypothetical protein